MILELSYNLDLGRQLPDELGNLINLQYLSLQWCSFNGPIPPVIGNLAKLTFLYVSFCMTFPTMRSRNQKLLVCGIQARSRLYSISRAIGEARYFLNIVWRQASVLDRIRVGISLIGIYIYISTQGFYREQSQWSISNTFGYFTQINWLLDLSTNAITGLIPVSSSPGSNGIGLNNMTSVKHLHLNNSPSGSILQEIFSLPNLIHLNLAQASIQ